MVVDNSHNVNKILNIIIYSFIIKLKGKIELRTKLLQKSLHFDKVQMLTFSTIVLIDKLVSPNFNN